MVNKAVIFDRDGVLNYPVDRIDRVTAPWTIDEFKFIPGAIEAVAMVNDKGYKTFVATNQPDWLDGNILEKDFNAINDLIRSSTPVEEICIACMRDSVYYKPNNGMMEYLIDKYSLDISRTYMIGDRWKDIVAGYKSGLKTIFVGVNYNSPDEWNEVRPDYIVDSAFEASKLILELDND